MSYTLLDFHILVLVIFLFSSFIFSRIFVIGTDFSTMVQVWLRFICNIRLSNKDIEFDWSIRNRYLVWLTFQYLHPVAEPRKKSWVGHK